MSEQLGQNKNRPDYKTQAYLKQLPAMEICQDVYGGTLPMRAKGKVYLPANAVEPKDDYESRLARSVMLPAFKRAITLALGLVFDEDPTTKDVPDEIVKHLNNIDLTGKPIGLFARDALKAALRDGHSFIYVDMAPKIEESETLSPEPTLRDEAAAGLRPYWVLFNKNQAINWRFENVGGRQVLKQITFRTCDTEPDGDYGEKEVVRYRVLNPGLVRVWHIDQNGNAVLDSEQQTSLDYIPLFPVYGGGEELEAFVSDPPLLDLALLNVLHYQMSSDLQAILHVANVPILWARDRDKKAPFMPVGQSVLIDLTGEHSELGYAEHQGNAIGKAQEEIKQIELRIAMAGFQLLADQTNGPDTATGELKDAAESDSELSLAVKSLAGALNLALIAHGDFLRTTITGSIELNVQYDQLVLSVQEMTELRNLANDNHLSQRNLLELLKRAGKLGKDFDVEKNLEEIYGADNLKEPDVVREANTNADRNPDVNPLTDPPTPAPAK